MELSIEEKAKRYDESKARMKAAWDSNRCTLGFMSEIFPELKESKDEKIRRIVYGWINTQPSGFFNLNDISKKDMLAWLDKREEKERSWDENEKAYFEFTQAAIENCYDENNPLRKELVAWLNSLKDKVQPKQGKSALQAIKEEKVDNANKVEPKFKGGDCLVDNCKRTWKVVGIKNGLYILEDENKGTMPSLIELVDRTFHLQTKQDGNLANDEKPTDEIIPKIGDWVVRKDGDTFTDGRKTVQITNIDKEQYWFDCGTWLCAEDIRLWNIKDAKDGDVLVLNNEVFIYAHRKQLYNIVIAHCFVDSADGFYLEGEFVYTEKGNSIHPATKEQSQMLFIAMYDAGYSWRVENKQLIKR